MVCMATAGKANTISCRSLTPPMATVSYKVCSHLHGRPENTVNDWMVETKFCEKCVPEREGKDPVQSTMRPLV